MAKARTNAKNNSRCKSRNHSRSRAKNNTSCRSR